MHADRETSGGDDVTSTPSEAAAALLRRAQRIAEQLHEEAVAEAERATAEAHRLEAE